MALLGTLDIRGRSSPRARTWRARQGAGGKVEGASGRASRWDIG